MSRLSHINIIMESLFELEDGGQVVVRGVIADLPAAIDDPLTNTISIAEEDAPDVFTEQFAFRAPVSDMFPILNSKELYSKVLIPLQTAFKQIFDDRTGFLIELEKKGPEG